MSDEQRKGWIERDPYEGIDCDGLHRGEQHDPRFGLTELEVDGVLGDQQLLNKLISDGVNENDARIIIDIQRDPHLSPLQWHHGYIGVGFVIVGALALLAELISILTDREPKLWLFITGLSLIGVGVYLAIEDRYQHNRQIYEPGYRSPINKLWGKVLRLWARIKG